MSELMLPTWIVPEVETHEWLDEASSVFAAAFAPGLAQRQSDGGLRLKLSRQHTVRAEEKAQLLSILATTRGRYNAIRTKVHFQLRGAGLGSELLSNNTFESGTTGWSADTDYSIAVADRMARATRTANVGNARYPIYRSVAASVVQYAPYHARAIVASGRGSFSSYGIDVGSAGAGDSGNGTTTSAGAGLKSHTFTSVGANAYFATRDVSASGLIAGDYFLTTYTSMSRCALIDNGANLFLRSDELDNAVWIKQAATVGANATTAPDGASTADRIIEDGTTDNHNIYQEATVSATAADYTFSVAVKQNNRLFCRLMLQELTSNTLAIQFFNIDTGAVGTTSSVGANWSNIRSHISALGNGWYRCTITVRKTNAATVIRAYVTPATADGTSSYLGDSSSGIYAWRATLAQASVPARLVQTTTTAIASGAAQNGGAVHVKGLPASTSGILLPGDFFEIDGEIKQAVAALNSDASGLGYLQFEPPLVRAPGDSAAVVIVDPVGRFLVSNIKVDNDFGTQARVSYDLEHIYE